MKYYGVYLIQTLEGDMQVSDGDWIIKIETHGHQFYDEVEGEVVQWCMAVERYSDLNCNPSYVQVPAVLLDVGDEIKLVPLQRQSYSVDKIKIIKDKGEWCPRG